MATARMHVNSYSGLLDKVFGLYSSSLDGAQRQGFCGFGLSGQANSGNGTTT
jgi:hypothetical protein